jgi:lipopolysaccharide export system protein LptA
MTPRSAAHVAAIVAVAVLAAAAAAQPMSGPPNALQGFSVNREKPVQITSNTLEVRDKEKRATFIGNVLVVQGDTTMKSKTLDVFYDQDGEADARTAQSAMPGQQQIRRLEAKGGVTVTQKDQTATGDTGIFDMPANTVTLLGNVVITQGPQVIRGERLMVNLTTSESRVEGGSTGVRALFHPNARTKPGDKTSDSKATDSMAADVREPRPEPRNGKDAKPKSAPGQPMRLSN